MCFLCLVVSLVIKPQNCKVKAEKRPTVSAHLQTEVPTRRRRYKSPNRSVAARWSQTGGPAGRPWSAPSVGTTVRSTQMLYCKHCVLLLWFWAVTESHPQGLRSSLAELGLLWSVLWLSSGDHVGDHEDAAHRPCCRCRCWHVWAGVTEATVGCCFVFELTANDWIRTASCFLLNSPSRKHSMCFYEKEEI